MDMAKQYLDMDAAVEFVKGFIPPHVFRIMEYLEAYIPSTNMIKPIGNYEAVRTVSIEEAVEPLVSLVPDIKEIASQTKQKCDPPKDGLTPDELTSIMLYTLIWEQREKSLYIQMNSTLRSEDQEKLKPWRLYIKLLVSSLEKLPSFPRTLYRGVKKDLSAQYPPGKVFVWYGFSSCTTSIHVLQSEEFLGKTGSRTLFSIDCESAKNIQPYSFVPSEDEVLLIAARKLQVMSCLDSGNGLLIIQLKEVGAEDPLLGSAGETNESSQPTTDASQPTHQKDSSASNLTSLNPQKLITDNVPKLTTNLPRFPF